MTLPTTYAVYLVVSMAITVWVARTLHCRGRSFLVESFDGNEQLADSVNALLVVGFYLVNFAYVALALKYGTKPTNFNESIEFVSTKVGLVLMLLSAMHFFNLIVFTRIAKRKNRPIAWAENPFRHDDRIIHH